MLHETMDGPYFQTLPIYFGVDYSSYKKSCANSPLATVKPVSQLTGDSGLAHRRLSFGEACEAMGKDGPSHDAHQLVERRQLFRGTKSTSSPIATVTPLQSSPQKCPEIMHSHERHCGRRRKFHAKSHAVDPSYDEGLKRISVDAADLKGNQAISNYEMECSTLGDHKANPRERKGGVARLAKLLDKTGSFSRNSWSCSTTSNTVINHPPLCPSVSSHENECMRPLATVEPLPISSHTNIPSSDEPSYVSALDTIPLHPVSNEEISSSSIMVQSPIKHISSPLLRVSADTKSDPIPILSTTCTVAVKSKETTPESHTEAGAICSNQLSFMDDDKTTEKVKIDGKAASGGASKSFTASFKMIFPLTKTKPIPLRRNPSNTLDIETLQDPTIVPVTQLAQLFHTGASNVIQVVPEENKSFLQRVEVEEELQLLRKSRKVAFRNPAARMSLDVSMLAPTIMGSSSVPETWNEPIAVIQEAVKAEQRLEDVVNTDKVELKEQVLKDVGEDERPSVSPLSVSTDPTRNSKKHLSQKQRRKTQPITIDDIAALNWKILMSEESSDCEDEEWKNMVQANKS